VNTTSEMESYAEITEKIELRNTTSTKRMSVLGRDRRVEGAEETPFEIK